MNYMEAAMAPAEANHRQAVLRSTFGHLAPKKHKTYRGSIVFGYGEYDSGSLNPTILQDNMGIEGSPWWYDEINEFIRTIHPDGGPCGAVFEVYATWRNYHWWQTGLRNMIEPSS